ncbi:MAG TPA: hypothetical protein VNH21_14660 [Steroidobacteraceae bacterium]|nr:hypothetical protein [Steroidobacteraceae bacterium]
MSTELDGFLKGEEPPDPAPAAPDPAPAPTPAVESKPPPPAEPEEADPEPAREGEAVIPRRAFEAIRHERQDWKAKAIEAQTRLAEVQRQFEEATALAQRAATAAAPPAPPIDPAVDPVGFVRALAEQAQRDRINERLNNSEEALREKIGAEAVDALIAEFKAEAAKNPALVQQLYQQRNPYVWVQKQVETMRLHREIGEDPAAFRARIIAEHEAARQAAEPPPRVSPAAGMAPSLATARSVAGRSAPAYTGPTPLADILKR